MFTREKETRGGNQRTHTRDEEGKKKERRKGLTEFPHSDRITFTMTFTVFFLQHFFTSPLFFLNHSRNPLMCDPINCAMLYSLQFEDKERQESSTREESKKKEVPRHEHENEIETRGWNRIKEMRWKGEE